MTASIPAPGGSLTSWLDAVAAPPPSPAGGSAAAIAAALAAALGSMVAAHTRAKPRLAAAHQRSDEVLAAAATLRPALLDLAVRDARAFEAFLLARGGARVTALRAAAAVQLDLLRGAAAAADLAATMAQVGAPTAVGDAATGAFLAAAAARSAYWGLRADLDAEAPGGDGMRSEGLELLEQAEAAEWRVRQILSERID